MKKCDVCGKRAEGLGTYPTQIQEVVLCSNCYEGLSDFRVGRKYSSLEKLVSKEKEILQEITEKNFPENVAQQFQIHFEEKKQEFYEKERIDNFSKTKDQYLMTSGYNFEGYDIIAYHGVICGESVLGTGFLSSWSASVSDMLGVESDSFIEKLQEARNVATQRAIERAIKAGGNAIIGVDIDYTMFTNNLIGVIFNGTSVSVEEKQER